MPWFSTKLQIAQTSFTALACIFGGIKAWPEMKGNQYLSIGALLFYVLVALVLASVFVLIKALSGKPKQESQMPNYHREAKQYGDATTPRVPSSASFEGFAPTLSNLRLAGSLEGAPRLDTTTSGSGKQTLELGIRPRRVLFDQPDCIVCDEELQKRDINYGEHVLSILRFTTSGIAIDDHGSQIHVKVYVLDGEPIHETQPM